MATYTKEELQPFLEDHARARGATDKYICPLTLQPCDISQLSRGHIVNDALGYKFNAKVPVGSHVDAFFGTRVESQFIEYMKLAWTSEFDILTSQRILDVNFREGGPTFKGFFMNAADVAKTAKHLPVYTFVSTDGKELHVGIKGVEKGNPELPAVLTERVSISAERIYLTAHSIASALKMAHLTIFYLIGYKAIYNPSSDAMRRLLMQYYYDDGSRKDASDYFRPYLNAVKVSFAGADPAKRTPATEIETLRDNKVICHYVGDLLFAISLMYLIRDKSIVVTIPQCVVGADIGLTTRLYDRLLAQDAELQQRTVVTKLTPDGWQPEGAINVRLLERM